MDSMWPNIYKYFVNQEHMGVSTQYILHNKLANVHCLPAVSEALCHMLRQPGEEKCDLCGYSQEMGDKHALQQ